MNLNREWHAEHPFAGQNTQQKGCRKSHIDKKVQTNYVKHQDRQTDRQPDKQTDTASI